MTWVSFVGSWGVRSRLVIVTVTAADEDTITDVTVLQVTDSHTVSYNVDPLVS